MEDAYSFDVTAILWARWSPTTMLLEQAQAQAEAQALAAQAEQEQTADGQQAPQEESAETAEGEAAEGETAEEEAAQQETVVDPNAPKNAYLQYDATSTAFVIVPDQPGKKVDWSQVTQQVQTAVLALEPQLELKLDTLVEQAQVKADSLS